MEDHANIVKTVLRVPFCSVGTCNHLSKVVSDDGKNPGSSSENNPELGVIVNYEGGNMCDEENKYSLQV